MSPLLLPRDLLHPWIDEILQSIDKGPLQEMLVQLKSRPTFAEQWPETYLEGQRKAKFTVRNLEQFREDKYTLDDILAGRPAVQAWWRSIDG
jgi:aryl carrier-like protein